MLGSRIAIILLIVGFVAYGLKYGFNVFVARHLSVVQYGDFGLALRLLSVLAVVSLLGTPAATKKFFGRYLRVGDIEGAEHYIRWNVQFVRPAFLACLCAAGISVSVMLILHLAGIKALYDYRLVFYMIWVAPAAALTFLFAAFLRAHLDVVAAQVAQRVATYGVMLLFFVVAVVLLDQALKNITVALLLLAAYLFVALGLAALVHRRMPGVLGTACRAAGVKRGERQPMWRRFAISLSINTTVFMGVKVADLVILDTFGADKDDVGAYVACVAISGAIWLVPKSGYQFLVPRIASTIRQNEDTPMLQRLVNHGNAVVFAFVVAISGLICFRGTDLLGHFGPSYELAYAPLLILSAAAVVGACGQVPRMIVMYSGGASALLRTTALEFTLAVGAGIPLTLFYGSVGTASSVFISVSVKAWALWILSRRYAPGLKPLSVF